MDISDSEEESPMQQNVADIKPELDYLDYEVPSQNMSSRDIVVWLLFAICYSKYSYLRLPKTTASDMGF